MSTTARSGSGLRRLGIVATAVVACAAAGVLVRSSRAADTASARDLAADDLASLERCLYGEPLRPNETLAGRMRGIELAVALAQDSDPSADTDDAANDAGATDASVDAAATGAEDAGGAEVARWPSRCAPLAETLGARLDSEALGRDRSLDALRDALPSRERFELPFALTPDEAADLSAAIAKANLVSHKEAAANEAPAPPFLLAPLSGKDLTPLGKGKLVDTDNLVTSTMHLILQDERPRLCTLDTEGATQADKPARCGNLEVKRASLINEEDGAPTAVLVGKERKGNPGSTDDGILLLGTPKAIPINGGMGDGSSTFLAKSGAYMIAAYAPLVRVGTLDKLKTTDVAQPALDTEALHADVAPGFAAAAYGYVFFNDQAPIYKSYDPDRRFWARQIEPSLSPKAVDLGMATSNVLSLLHGCKRDGRTAVVFEVDDLYAKDPKKKTVRVAISEGDGPLHGIDAEIGDSSPHFTCLRDAVVATSIAHIEKDKDHVVVVESRCTASGCSTQRSEPVAVAGLGSVSAATTDAGVLMVWSLRADRVLSRAHGMVFYRLAALDKLAAASPRPIFENHRNGGFDVDSFGLVARSSGSLVRLQAGGKAPVTYAVRIDATGAMSPVRVEETEMVKDAEAPKSRAKQVVRVVLGVVIGCTIAEFAFSMRDHGAFPHLNAYRVDADLGVRLRPGATEKLAFGPNPATNIRINAEGFRGTDWPAPGEDEVLVVGDSQVFGLGVEENETTSSVLAATLGKTVLNAGVPTYGPPEYAKMVSEVFEKRHPKSVVFVVNFANDLYEASHPNKARHTSWDGWAVHRESAPQHITEFPGRQLLYGQSHAFFAARQLWYERRPSYDNRSFAPKKTWRDIALTGLAAEDEHAKAAVDTARLAQKHTHELGEAARNAALAQKRIEGLLNSNMPGSLEERNEATYHAATASPGDIVGYVSGAEWEEPVVATAELIREGAIYRQKIEQLLRDKAKADAALASEVDKSFDARETTNAKLIAVVKEPPAVVRAWSPVAPSLREVKAACDAHGARLFVVALPLDVQISPDEWAKYGADPVDIKPAELLVSDVVDAALAIGATPIDPTEALRAAEPGAFLYGDIHMTPKGHHALADLIAKTMKEPPPLPKPRPGIAAGRSRVPLAKEWNGIREVTVHGSDAAQCTTYMVREWLRVYCKMNTPAAPKPLGIKVVEGGRGEAFVTAGENVIVLTVPLLEGDHFGADFSWSDRTQRLAIQWAKGAVFPEMVFKPPSSKTPSETPPPLDLEPFCGCYKAHDALFSCPGSVLAPSPDCARTYGADCEKLVACVESDPETLPTCPQGQANGGATGRCFPLCSEDRPCAAGLSCSEWQGGRICM